MTKYNFFKILFRRHYPELNRERKQVLEAAKARRQEANERIDNMVAQINGCGDRWFLQPDTTIDECQQNGET